MQHVDRMIGVAAAALGFVALSACSTAPATVELSAVPARASTEIVVAPQPPPPIRVEIPPPAPSSQALWRFGHWSWDGRQFVWNPGQYVERPSPTASWIPDHWEQRPEGWIRIDGQWV